MFKFISEASGELEHVVWPTPKENKKYMMYTIGVIVVIGVFLSVLGFIVTNGLSWTRSQFPHDAVESTVSGEEPLTQAELDKLLKKVTVNTGATATGITTSSGVNTGTGNK